MAFSQVRHSETFKAASNFDGTQFRIVELTSNAHEAELGAANEGYGVLQNHPPSGEAATVAAMAWESLGGLDATAAGRRLGRGRAEWRWLRRAAAFGGRRCVAITS